MPLPHPRDPAGGEAPVLLAVGAHLKNTVALRLGRQVFVSQHLGDMETPAALAAFETAVADFLDLWEARPAAIVHDLHPDYATTRWAAAAADGTGGAQEGGPAAGPSRAGGRFAALAGLPLLAVQHHHAHLAACLAENATLGDGDEPVIGFTWDGTGYGDDGTVWGGETLLGGAAGYVRAAHLRPFRLPGGDAAVREPRRSALALLWEVHGGDAERWSAAALAAPAGPATALAGTAELPVFRRMLEGGLHAPVTTSAGRLFDGVAALLGLHPRATFEGQAAMALEAAADLAESGAYPLDVTDPAFGGGPLEIDWRPLVHELLADLRRGASRASMAGRFHNGLVAAIAEVARRLAPRLSTPRVALTGGCFQNRLLTEGALHRLRRDGFEVLLHRRVPANDGGIAFGQAVVAAARLAAAGGASSDRIEM